MEFGKFGLIFDPAQERQKYKRKNSHGILANLDAKEFVNPGLGLRNQKVEHRYAKPGLRENQKDSHQIFSEFAIGMLSDFCEAARAALFLTF